MVGGGVSPRDKWVRSHTPPDMAKKKSVGRKFRYLLKAFQNYVECTYSKGFEYYGINYWRVIVLQENHPVQGGRALSCRT